MFLLGLSAAYGQESTGSIIGIVTDVTGASVPDAQVVATSPRVPRGLETTTDGSGNFNLLNVPTGTYTVTITKTGFQAFRQNSVEVRLGSQVSVNPKLAVGQVSEVVEVTEAVATLDVTQSSVQTSIGESIFDNIQKGRTFNSILAIAPGVRTEIKGGAAGVGGISVNGASGSENVYYIDGTEQSDILSGALRAQSALPLEFVQEVNIRTAGFEAEHGGATGGVVNVGIKSGQNEFHGEVYGQVTGDSLNASDRGYWQRSVANVNVAEFFRPREDDYRIWYPGATLGGRLIRDRLFFFAGYSPEIERTNRVVPYAAGAREFKQERLRHYGTGRIDWAASSKLQVYNSWIWSPFRRSGTLPSRDERIAAPTNDLSIQGGYVPAQAYNAGATYSLTPRIVLQARYGYRYQNDKDGNYGLSGLPFITYNTASAQAGLPIPAGLEGGTGFRNVSSTLQTQINQLTRHNVFLDGSFITNLFGQQHTFKGGYALNRLGHNIREDFTNGQFNIFWGDAFTRGSVTNQRGAYGYYVWEDGVRLNARVNGRNQGFYVQDQWRVHPRVTLNLGVRFENEFLPPYREEQGGVRIANPVSFGWGDKVAPRLGGAWDILGDGRWKLSASFGYFYDVMKYSLAEGSFGGQIWFSNVYTLDNPNVNALSLANPGALGRSIVRFDNRTVPINAQGELEGIDPDIQPTKSRNINVTLDRQLTSRLTASLRYTRTDLLRIIEDIGVLEDDSEVYLIGNPGYGQTRNTASAFGQQTPNGNFLVPKGVRQYDAVEFRLQGQVGGLTLIPSYTWSRLYGNTSGLANSDESGRSDPGVSRAFDLPYYYFDQSGSQENVLGLLGTDRPHAFKFFGSYELPNTRLGRPTIGINQLAYSGTPDTTTVIYLSAPTSPFGRGDLGRTPAYTQTDLFFRHEVRPTERFGIRFEAEIRNLFNQAAVIQRTTQLNRNGAISAAQLPLEQFFRGYDVRQFVSPGSVAGARTLNYNAIYGLPSGNYRNGGAPAVGGIVGTSSSAFAATNPNFGGYQDFRTIRLGLRLVF